MTSCKPVSFSRRTLHHGVSKYMHCFRLVYDRETGKPKGYGFCEYKDQETALSAMRNLNGYEIGGRTLRVDNACTEKSRMEMQSKLLFKFAVLFCKDCINKMQVFLGFPVSISKC